MRDRRDYMEGPERLDKQEANSYSFKTVQFLLRFKRCKGTTLRIQGCCCPLRYLMGR